MTFDTAVEGRSVVEEMDAKKPGVDGDKKKEKIRKSFFFFYQRRSIKEYINTIVVTGIDHHIQHFFRRSN